MTDATQPVGNIRPQVLSSSPLPAETTLVDDPVALVDDPKVLTGSQTTQIGVLRATAKTNSPKGKINTFNIRTNADSNAPKGSVKSFALRSEASSNSPKSSIKPQTLTSSPIPVETTLVDDPIALVDDPIALIGSQTTQISVLRTTADSNAPVGSIKLQR